MYNTGFVCLFYAQPVSHLRVVVGSTHLSAARTSVTDWVGLERENADVVEASVQAAMPPHAPISLKHDLSASLSASLLFKSALEYHAGPPNG